MKHLYLIAVTMFLCPVRLPAITQGELDDDVLSLTNSVGGVFMLAHDEDVDEALKGMLNRPGRTPHDLSQALVLAAQGFKIGTGPFDGKMRLGIISCLGDFGTTNAIPFLEDVMRNGDMDSARTAVWSFLGCIRRGITDFEGLTTVLKSDRKDDFDLHKAAYDACLIDVEYGEMSPETKAAYRDFLVKASSFDVVGANILDAVSCRAFPDFADSPERLAMARRLAAEERIAGVANGRFASLAAELEAKATEQGVLR